MKLKALSCYDGDKDTRFGDCLLIYDNSSLIVYDCGHTRHAAYVESFLRNKPTIISIYIVVSHNDSDHTNGVCELLEWLSMHMYLVTMLFVSRTAAKKRADRLVTMVVKNDVQSS